MKTPQKFTVFHRLLHWLMALAMPILFITGLNQVVRSAIRLAFTRQIKVLFESQAKQMEILKRIEAKL